MLAAAIFLLTKPPAYNRISEEARPWVGLLLLVVPIGFALKEIDAVFVKRKPSAIAPPQREIVQPSVPKKKKKKRG